MLEETHLSDDCTSISNCENTELNDFCTTNRCLKVEFQVHDNGNFSESFLDINDYPRYKDSTQSLFK